MKKRHNEHVPATLVTRRVGGKWKREQVLRAASGKSFRLCVCNLMRPILSISLARFMLDRSVSLVLHVCCVCQTMRSLMSRFRISQRRYKPFSNFPFSSDFHPII